MDYTDGWIEFQIGGENAYYRRLGAMIEVHEFLGEESENAEKSDLTAEQVQEKMPIGISIDREKHPNEVFTTIEAKINPHTGVVYYQREFKAFVDGWQSGFMV